MKTENLIETVNKFFDYEVIWGQFGALQKKKQAPTK